MVRRLCFVAAFAAQSGAFLAGGVQYQAVGTGPCRDSAELAGIITVDNHNNLYQGFSNPEYQKDVTDINHAGICYFAGTDYFHISTGYGNINFSGYTVVNEMMYKGERYIGDLVIHGNVVDAMKK